MIKNEGKHYLYRHIRLDKNEPFYIGIGTKQKHSDYPRANFTTNRKTSWKNITNKTDYEIEILLESDDYEFIKQKEIEFIALYGRRDLGKGTLVNHTDGGEGTKGWIPSEETRDKIRKAHDGKRFRGDNHNAKKVIDISTGKIYPCSKDASEELGYNNSTFKSYLNGGLWNKTTCMYLKDYEQGLRINENTKAPPPLEREYKYINKITGEKYTTIMEIAKEFGYSHPYAYSMIYGKRPNKLQIELL